MILLLSTALLLAAVLLNACGNGHAQTRFVAAVPSATGFDFLIDGKILASNLAFSSTNGSYETISSGNHTIEVRPTGTTTDLVNASNVDFINHDQYTLYFTGLTQANETVNQVPDDNTLPTNGNIKLRFFQAAPSISGGRVDVYVVAPSTPITNLSPNVASLAYQQASTYLNVTASTYEIIVTQAGSKSPLIDQPPLAFTAGQIRTFVILDNLTVLELADLN